LVLVKIESLRFVVIEVVDSLVLASLGLLRSMLRPMTEGGAAWPPARVAGQHLVMLLALACMSLPSRAADGQHRF